MILKKQVLFYKWVAPNLANVIGINLDQEEDSQSEKYANEWSRANIQMNQELV